MILIELEAKAADHERMTGKKSLFIVALYKRVCIRLLQRRDVTMKVADLAKSVSMECPFNVYTYGTAVDAKLAGVADEIFTSSDARNKKLASTFIVPGSY